MDGGRGIRDIYPYKSEAEARSEMGSVRTYTPKELELVDGGTDDLERYGRVYFILYLEGFWYGPNWGC